MRNVDDIQPDDPAQGFQFPGTFEIAAMGNAGADLEARVPALLEGQGLTVVPDSMRCRASREGHFVSVHVRFECPSRELYQAAHAVLRAEDDIRYTL